MSPWTSGAISFVLVQAVLKCYLCFPYCIFLCFISLSLIFLSVAGCIEIFFLNVITEINFYY